MIYHFNDKVRIVANKHHHGFRIGDVVTIQNPIYSYSGLHYMAEKDGRCWRVRPEEIVPVGACKGGGVMQKTGIRVGDKIKYKNGKAIYTVVIINNDNTVYARIHKKRLRQSAEQHHTLAAKP